ncbi:type II toxin-antitoxin system RelE/ParE family toxin [Siccibacter turicensis]|uniref:type II toxin-antitoxin system RelE/ParE family toxin n=1 Tax=Siccibacter turicensis TaxID=357233 RepID=UPI0023F3A90D|nr:type II toxin-antitoxin system RelE/ParE family toxin [Siccibacter turicensis]
MMTRRIELTPKAGEDLEAIWRYGKSRFGEAQADNYIGKLSSQFNMLACHDVGVTRPELSKGIYSLACAHHVIFFLRTDTSITVVRVLHHSQDVMRHLPR